MAMFGNADQAFQVFSDPAATTCKASGAITGKRFVKLVAGGTFQQPKVALCGAGEQAFGVAAYTVADGESVTVVHDNTYTVTAGTNLTAPLEIQSDATGKAIALAAGKRLGSIYSDAVAAGDAAVRLTGL